ncbi:Inorganic pyrophosphatase [Actinomortierella ambigua]|nr:Inorganic pyrophosphatase [Actinomortierella ambigua]
MGSLIKTCALLLASAFLLGGQAAPSSASSKVINMKEYTTRVIGSPNTLGHRIYFEKKGVPISAFHDIPLYANKEKSIVNMIVEIPRWTNAKINKADVLNPLKIDVKDGKPRFVKHIFPNHGYIWNYGAFPQTWEDPTVVHPDSKAIGDNDPLDVCEIGQQIGYTGQIKQVKVLGVIGLLDQGESDWKVIVIDIKDPMASKLNDIKDVEIHLPGLLDTTREFYRTYKIPDGKAENKFAFNGKFMNRKYAHGIIQETHNAWKRLINGKVPPKTDVYDIQVVNLTVDKSPYKVTKKDKRVKAIPRHSPKPPVPIDPSFDKWYFVSSKSK